MLPPRPHTHTQILSLFFTNCSWKINMNSNLCFPLSKGLTYLSVASHTSLQWAVCHLSTLDMFNLPQTWLCIMTDSSPVIKTLFRPYCLSLMCLFKPNSHFKLQSCWSPAMALARIPELLLTSHHWALIGGGQSGYSHPVSGHCYFKIIYTPSLVIAAFS